MRPPRNEPLQCVRCLNRFNPEWDTYFSHRWREKPIAESEDEDRENASAVGIVLCPSCHREFVEFIELDREMARGPSGKR